MEISQKMDRLKNLKADGSSKKYKEKDCLRYTKLNIEINGSLKSIKRNGSFEKK